LIRLLADENVPVASIDRLRAAGLDVATVASGATDESILARAADEGRILLTLDRDFGWLALRGRGALPPGVIYMRIRAARPESHATVLLSSLSDPGLALEGQFTVVGRTRVRQRRLRPTH